MSVEMGVPIDRGLTQVPFLSSWISINVEMGVPIDRGLTHFVNSALHFFEFRRNGCPDR